MRILHTADWHLGKRLHHFDRLPEQRAVLDELVRIADQEKVDLVLIAGDLYDVVNPSHEAQELFYRTLRKLGNDGRRPVVAIAGNHDSPDLIGAPDPLARECGIILLGYPNSACPLFQLDSGLAVTTSEPGFLQLQVPGIEFPVRILTTPFANEVRMKQYLGQSEEEGMREVLQHQWTDLAEKYCNEQGVNLLTAHLFVASRDADLPKEPELEKPIQIGTASIVYADLIPESIQYAALGHLHRSQVIADSSSLVAYSGSPLGYSFSESGQQKVVHLLEIEPAKPVTWQRIPLEAGRQLVRKTFDQVSKALEWLQANDESLVELTLRTEYFLTAKELRSIRKASPFVLNIIPEPTQEQELMSPRESISLDQLPEELFTSYFLQQKGQEPTPEILALFRELVNQKEG